MDVGELRLQHDVVGSAKSRHNITKMKTLTMSDQQLPQSRVRDRYLLTQALVVDPLYLQHSYSESAIDYRVGLTLPKKVTVLPSLKKESAKEQDNDI